MSNNIFTVTCLWSFCLWLEQKEMFLGVANNEASTKAIHNKKVKIAVSLHVEPNPGLSFLMQPQV